MFNCFQSQEMKESGDSFSDKYLTRIPWARVEYEMVNSQRGPWDRVGYNQSRISNKREWNNCFTKFGTVVYLEIIVKFY